MKKYLGIDIGPNSIGWAIVCSDGEGMDEELQFIEAAGSRIIPTDADTLGKFDSGNSISQTADRTASRSVRRLYERCKLRRERLNRVLQLIGFLPSHYSKMLNRYGQFVKGSEPKLAWRLDDEGKPEFVFQEAFQEMMADFSQKHPDLIAGGKKIPYDWTLYYLRKKALTRKVSKEELAWILLNFNQKRGYYQTRGDEEDTGSRSKKELCDLKVVRVEDTGKKRGAKTLYNIYFENGKVYEGMPAAVSPNREGQVKEVLVTTEEGKKDKFQFPQEGDWILRKAKTQRSIEQAHQTVGTYIYEALLSNPSVKIRGKLVHTIEREYYKDELRQILDTQKRFHPELRDRELYLSCLQELYPLNEGHRKNLSGKDLSYFFLEDILFYQRPLKSKKSLIDNCPYEEHEGKDPETGEKRRYAVKCIARSNPLFQEFRLWQFLSNLRIYRKDAAMNRDVTSDFLKNNADYVSLFDWLNDRKEINQKTFLSYPPFKLKKEAVNYRWNYVEDEGVKYPASETRGELLAYLKKAGIPESFLTKEREQDLWQILYSVEDKSELRKALVRFAARFDLDEESFAGIFLKIPPFAKEYGAYSAKAIKKLLPLMRCGKYWDERNIDPETRQRIDRIINGECDESIRQRVREKAIHLHSVEDFQRLPLWLACYVVYDRHSEAKEIVKWKSYEDIDRYLQTFRQHSLHNPIVEKVVLETLRVVRDVWRQVGNIDEIHVELGREMKKTAKERERMSKNMRDNENRNLRIKYLLTEFMNPEFEIENVRAYSQSQQEVLRIYEEEVLENNEQTEEILNILKKFNESEASKRPTHQEVLRYKLWLDQKYRSPYTGRIIPLAKLFTPAYEIEHIIPRARYFDDSFNNKVICETEVNKVKGQLLGHEFITKHKGEIILTAGGSVNVFTVEGYEAFVKEHYARNRRKMQNLLLDDLPDSFINRQLNDTRYISKLVRSLLSNIVREEDEQEAVSKHVISCTGEITDRLKKDWGIHDVWNRLILPRFKRMNEVTGQSVFTALNTNGQEIPNMPLEYQKGFQKKRIDHRHHAMDAIMIACASRNIINYLNNLSATSGAKLKRVDLQQLLCEPGDKKLLKKPWPTFTQDVARALDDIIVSFKQNVRVLTRTSNHISHYGPDGKKHLMKQAKGDGWAIRKSLHKETVFGEVNLRKIKTVSLKEAMQNPQSIVEKDFKRQLKELMNAGWDIKRIKAYFEERKEVWHEVDLAKIRVYYFTKDTSSRLFAVRKLLDDTFDAKKIKEKITDTGIQKILLRHLEQNGGDPKRAFSPEGIDEMNENIQALNGGVPHKPILKVRYYEEANKFAVGESGNKSAKFVEADKGTNLYFAVYETEETDKKTNQKKTKRMFASIPLKVVISRLKDGLPPVPENEEGKSPLFILSPNDLVYLPTAEEQEKGYITHIDKTRIYKMVSCDKKRCFSIPAFVATSLVDKLEFSSQNKMERAITGKMIKETCVPIKVDRLGNIISIQNLKTSDA